MDVLWLHIQAAYLLAMIGSDSNLGDQEGLGKKYMAYVQSGRLHSLPS